MSVKRRWIVATRSAQMRRAVGSPRSTPIIAGSPPRVEYISPHPPATFAQSMQDLRWAWIEFLSLCLATLKGLVKGRLTDAHLWQARSRLS